MLLVRPTLTPEQRNVILTRSLEARDQLKRLRSSEDFRTRYAKGDPAAVEAFKRLTYAMAEGTSIKTADREGDSINFSAEQASAWDQSVAVLKNDPDFAKKLENGDPGAVRLWRETVGERGAELLGVSAVENNGAPPVASGQPGPTDVGAAKAGGAS